MDTSDDKMSSPVVEVVLGVQFSPLMNLSSAHFGLIWQDLGVDVWKEPKDQTPLNDQFERFDEARLRLQGGFPIRLAPVVYPGRLMLTKSTGDRLIQIQSTRFHYNWRKNEYPYPNFVAIEDEFRDVYKIFQRAIKIHLQQEVILNQWEITYVNAFKRGDSWNSLDEWSRLLPGLFGKLFPSSDMGLELEHRGAEWSYALPKKSGRLHISAKLGRIGDDDEEFLLLQSTVRGPVNESVDDPIEQGLQLGHDVALQSFQMITGRVFT